LDVVLAETPIGDGRADGVKLQRFAGLIELQKQVGLVVEIRPGDQLEPVTLPGAGEFREKTSLLKNGCVIRGDTGIRDSSAR
jgi:hypothetical protein